MSTAVRDLLRRESPEMIVGEDGKPAVGLAQRGCLICCGTEVQAPGTGETFPASRESSSADHRAAQ